MLRAVRLPQLAARLMPILAMLLAGSVSIHCAWAQLSVSETEDGLIVEAHDIALEKVLEVLGERHDLHHRSTFALDRRIDGTYEGPLRRVVAHLLDGCDYVMKTQAGHVEVLVLGLAKRSDARPELRQAGTLPTRRRSD